MKKKLNKHSLTIFFFLSKLSAVNAVSSSSPDKISNIKNIECSKSYGSSDAFSSRDILGVKEDVKEVKEIEKEYNNAHMSDLVSVDKQHGESMRQSSAITWFELRKKALQELKETGRDDFSYEPHKFVLERFIRDFQLRKTRKFGEMFAKELDELTSEATKLLHVFPNGHPPYKETHRFITYKVLPLYDQILGMRHPKLLANEYHRKHADHKFEGYMKAAPDLLLSYSFLLWGDSFFVYSRPAPHRQIGINLSGLDDTGTVPHADNWDMKISEFAHHDFGHVEFEADRDLKYIEKSKKDIVRVVFEWENTKNRIRSVVNQVREKKSDLATSMERILMEMMHERGFNYSLSVLKQELETVKWQEIIERKHNAGFYTHYPVNEKQFDLIDEARTTLLKAVERFKDEDQIKWLTAVNGSQVPAKITYNPPIQYAKGQLNSIEIKDSDSVVFHSEKINRIGADPSKITALNIPTLEVPIREFVSAQVAATKNSPLNKKTLSTISKVLKAIKSKKSISHNSIDHTPKSIIIKADFKIYVKTSENFEIPLSEIVFHENSGKKIPKLMDLQIFEINQILGASERNEELSFTIRPSEKIYTGFITTS